GMSIVKLIKHNNNILEVSGVDILDNTPLIDVKPYIPRFDIFQEASNGRIEFKKLRPKPLARE
ncbi:MAG: TrmO family methyltransferase, partial [Candidatus Omnitrophota bacterium]